jgi:two-component system, LytTR family, response regulator
MLKTIIIDDEPAAIEILERNVKKVPFIELKKSFFSTAEALAYLHIETIDLIFLDIQMPDMLGTDFARLIQNKPIQIVLTTAFSEYAVEGFSLQVLDFLIKPIEFSRFLQACNRAYERSSTAKGEQASIFVKDGYDWLRINLDEILYIQSDTNLLFIHEKNRKISTRMTIKEMLDILPKDKFIRIHKSYIVALKAIQKIERHQITVENFTIPLALSYKEVLGEKLLVR